MQQQQQVKRGRPPLPKAARKEDVRRFRLDAEGLRTLSRVKKKLGTDNDSEALRAALAALAERLGVAS